MDNNLVINLVEDIVSKELLEEQNIFSIFKEQMLEQIRKNGIEETNISEHPEFGDGGDLLSYFVLAYVASIAKELSKEGISLTKVTLNEWMKKKKKNINKKFNSKILKEILSILEKYLSK